MPPFAAIVPPNIALVVVKVVFPTLNAVVFATTFAPAVKPIAVKFEVAVELET